MTLTKHLAMNIGKREVLLAGRLFILLLLAMLRWTTTAAQVQYSYDSLNRLTNVDYGNGSLIGYTYDAVGNRLTYSGTAANDTTAPTITTPPQTQTAVSGNTISFTVAATGSGPLTYQWQVSTNGGGNWTNLSNNATYAGVQTTTLTLNGLIVAMNRYQFRAVVSNGASSSTPSAAATLTVNATFSGTVKYYTLTNAVPGVAVNVSGDASAGVTTGGGGTFQFALTAGGNYTVTPSKTTDTPTSLGVTTLDITLVRRHILGIAALDSPYKILAADVNNSSNVTTLDITLIRRVILGITNTFPAGPWKFVRSDFTFTNSLLPFSYEGSRVYPGLAADQVGQDFIGIKSGDVNGSWTPPAAGQAAQANLNSELETARPSGAGETKVKMIEGSMILPNTPAVIFTIGHAAVVNGSVARVPVTVSGFAGVTSAQFTLEWDPAEMEFAGVRDFGLPGLSEQNFGSSLEMVGTHSTASMNSSDKNGTRWNGSLPGSLIEQRQLTFSWDDPNGIGANVQDGRALFQVEFKAVSAVGISSIIEFADRPTLREVTVGCAPVVFRSENGIVMVRSEPEWPGVAVAVAPRLSLRGDEGLVLAGEAGRVYRIEYAEELGSGGVWKALTTVRLEERTEQIVPIERAGSQQRFYRAVLVR